MRKLYVFTICILISSLSLANDDFLVQAQIDIEQIIADLNEPLQVPCEGEKEIVVVEELSPQQKCLQEITTLPYCVGQKHAETFCRFPEESINLAKNTFNMFVDKFGESPRNASLLAFAGMSSDVSPECR